MEGQVIGTVKYADDLVILARDETVLQCMIDGGEGEVKESRNRPGVAQRVPGGLGSQTFDTWKVVRSSASHTGRLYTQECSWYSFSLGAESTPGPWYGRKEVCH
jgi:hypothetical protein